MIIIEIPQNQNIIETQQIEVNIHFKPFSNNQLMGAPLGNKFWMNRMDMTKDGRKLSVEQVTEKIAEYIERCVKDSIPEKDWVGKDAVPVERPHRITMSIWGASVHLAITHETWIQWRNDKKYTEVIKRAEAIFKTWNVEGASAGMLHHSIIARLEGLTEKQDITSQGEKIKSVIKFGGKDIEIQFRFILIMV